MLPAPSLSRLSTPDSQFVSAGTPGLSRDIEACVKSLSAYINLRLVRVEMLNSGIDEMR